MMILREKENRQYAGKADIEADRSIAPCDLLSGTMTLVQWMGIERGRQSISMISMLYSSIFCFVFFMVRSSL